MKKVFKFISRFIWFLFVSIIIGYNMFLLNAKLVLHEQLPMLGGYGYAVVLSGSMEPLISVNDLLIIQEQSTYKIDDIVTYVDDENKLITHRLIATDGNSVTAKGDANNVADHDFQTERIRGKVVAIIPKLGYIVVLFQNPICVISVVVLSFILLEYSYSREEKDKSDDTASIKAEIEALKSAMKDTDHTSG